MNKIKVLLADDQQLFLDSLKTVIGYLSDEIEIIGTASNGLEVISFIQQEIPDLILLDVRMPEMDGIEVVKYLSTHYSDIKIVMLTTFDDDDYVQEALKYNAVGYVLKDTPLTDFIKMIPTVTEGTVLISQKVAKRILSGQIQELHHDKNDDIDEISNITPDWYDDLTPRELDVLTCVAQGLDNAEIAQTLCIAEQTVKNHVSIIYSKLGVHKRLQAMRLGRSIL